MSMLSGPSVAEQLLRVDLFSRLPSDDLQRVCRLVRPLNLPAGKAVCCQGEPGEEMFILVSGSVEIRIRLADGKILSHGALTSGDAFGEIALLDGRPRTADVITREPCDLLVLSRRDFVDLLRQQPDIAIHLLETLARRFRLMDESIKGTLLVDIPQRIARVLHRLAHEYGKHTRKGLRIDAPFSDLELAEITGLEPELVTGQLHAWSEEGLIRQESVYITIRDTDRLARIQGGM